MEDFDLLLAVQAHREGRSQPRRIYRHVHLTDRPVAMAMVQMAGEPFSLWGAMVGSERGDPRLIVAPEPRNTSIELLALTDFAELVVKEIEASANGVREDIPRRNREPFRRCSTAPQLLVSNGAVVSLLSRLGRRMRGAGYSGKFDVPEVVNQAGAHLGFYAESARRPGSSLCVVATEQLSRHFATGQSAFEDDHLGTQLAWLDPDLIEGISPGLLKGPDPRAISGVEAAALVEQLPMGVLTDPERDSETLVDLVMRFNRERDGAVDRASIEPLSGAIEDELRAVLWPIWNSLWLTYDALDELGPAASVDERWAEDLSEFTRHVDYVGGGGRMRSVDSVRRAAMVLGNWEDALESLVHAEATEDPLGLVEAIASGQAVDGTVLKVDRDNMEQGPKRMVRRPLITLQLANSPPFPKGTSLWWSDKAGLEAEVIETSGAPEPRLILKVVKGMSGTMPEIGETAVFTRFGGSSFRPAPLPKDVPWTHEPVEGSLAAGGTADLDGGPPLDKALGPEGPT